MKSLKKGIISLLAFVMALTLTPSVFAATDEDASGSGTAASYKVTNPGASSEDGLYSNKTLSLNDDGTGTITLETYVTGSIQQTGTPTDIVLVLDVSQSMSQSMGSTTRLAALKAAVSTFIDTTAKKNEAAKTEDLKSRISIVSFSGSATVVSDFSTDATTLKSKVNSLTTSRGTAADYGMQKAQSQVSSIPASRESNKVVIFFTDGEPNHGSGSFDTSVANDAISAAKTIKAAGATVYSIGVVSGADPSLDPTQSSTSNINKFLHGISSNYPDATTYTNLGTRAKDSKGNDLTCYKSATNASELEKIFDDIGEEAVPSVKLDASSVVQDAMSEYVVSDVSDDNPIQLYTSKYTGNDTFADPVAAPDAVTADVSDGIVKVTGFDFEPVIDKEDGTCQGQKLIVEIPVKLTDEAKSMSGETLNSNDEDSSAIYVEGEQTPVRKFGTPTVGIPKTKITVTANSAEKVYDGKALTDNGYTIEGTLAKGDVLTAVVEGTQTNAGSSPNEVKSYKVMRGDKDVTDMYDITPKNGTLTVTPIGDKVTVTITGKSGSYDYDGTKKTVTGYTASSSNVLYNVDGDKKDYEFNGSDSVSGTNVDTYDMGLRAEDFKNTNNNFTNVEFVIEKDGQLTITPKEVAFEGETANKIYNGEEQTITGITADGLVQGHEYSGLTYAAKGTNVGDYNGKFSGTLVITDKEGNDVTKNYKVTKTPGTLTITPFTDEVVVTIKENSGTYEYDGTEKKVTGYTVSINNAKYTEDDFTFSGDATVTRTDAGTSNMELKESDFKNKNDNFENVKFVIEDGQLKITKKAVTFKGETASKVYNRKEQKITKITDTGLIDGHKYSGLEYVAKGTDVGEYDGEFSGDVLITDAEGNDVTKNYKVTKNQGKLTITPVEEEIVVTITEHSGKETYDGTEKKVTGYDASSSNDLYIVEGDSKDFEFTGDATVTGTDVDTYNMELKESDFDNKNENFSKVKFVIVDGQLEITKKAVTFTGETASKVYTGEEQEINGITVDGLIEGHEYSELTYSAKRKTVGTTDGTFSGEATIKDAKGNDVTKNYDVTKTPGKLTITEYTDEIIVTIKENSGTYEYDGTEKKVTGYTVSINNDKYTEDDFTFSGDATVTRTDAGTSNMELKESDFKNKNENFNKVTFVIVDGQLEITKKAVTFKGETASKVYNREEQEITGITDAGLVDGHKYSGLEYVAKGTNVGDYNGKFSGSLVITDKEGNNVTENYDVTKTPGTLTITPITEEVVVTIRENSATYEYDGTEKKATGYSVVSIDNPNYTKDDFTFSGDATVTRTDAGTSNMELKPEDFDNKNDNFKKVKFVIEDGQLVITEKAVTFKGETASKVYNREEQKITKITDAGLVDGHKYSGLEYVAKGTNVGDYNGKFSGSLVITDKEGNDVTKNYKVTKTPGTLTITPITDEVVVTIQGNRGTYEYDGTEKKVTGYDASSSNDLYIVEGDSKDFEFTGDATVTGTDVDTYDMKLKESDFDNTNKNFTNVKFVIEDGQLKITKKAVTFEGETTTREYNREEQKITGITQNGLVDGHEYSELTYSAKGTNVGEYDGEFSGEVVIKDAKGNDVTKNYKVTTKPGKLTITPVQREIVVTITEHSGTETYDGTEKKVTGYDASSNDDIYYVEGDKKDFEFSGDATVTGTDVGNYDMELKKSDFENTNKNFTNVKFVIKDGQLIITPAKITNYVELTPKNTEKVYDGTPLAAGEATAKDSLGKNRLKIEYSVDGKTWTEDYKEITATNVADSKTVKVRVSDDDKGNYEGYVEGTETITITPATLKVVTPSAKKTYDGEPLTKKGTISGLIEGETLTFKTTGTQTKVGKSDNTYEIVWDGTAVESNYTIVAEIGELEVTKAKDTPDTGDDSNVVLYGFMGLTALAAELFMVSRRRRNGAK